MRTMVERAGALDIHKKSITACVRTPGPGRERVEQLRTFAAFLDGLTQLRQWLLEHGVTQVAMEATSSYWVPVWRVLEEGKVFDQLLLCNARHVKHVPGRKTDVKDASWLCQLLEAGLLRGSFVPPPPQIRRLRHVTPLPQAADPAAHIGDPAGGEGPGRRRDQDRVGGVQDPHQVRPCDDRSADRGRA